MITSEPARGLYLRRRLCLAENTWKCDVFLLTNMLAALTDAPSPLSSGLCLEAVTRKTQLSFSTTIYIAWEQVLQVYHFFSVNK